jgi:CheY-like chemotaxis protein
MNTSAANADRTVLIVDDDDFSQELMRGVLEELGVRNIALASSGKSAVEALSSLPRPPDLLICDLYMPDMDGFEFMDALVKKNYKGNLVLCSGVSLENLVLARDIGKGMGLHLLGAYEKPIPISEFERMLASLPG